MIILSKHKEFRPYIICILTIKNTILSSLLTLISFFCVPNYLISQEKPFVVVLDAGHGGHDTGNRGNGYYEKKIALNIALKTGNKHHCARKMVLLLVMSRHRQVLQPKATRL